MTEIFIEGRLGKIVGNYHKLNCLTLGEVFDAIECNTGKLKKYISLNKRRMFSVFIDDKLADPDFFAEERVKNKKITILPILMGAIGLATVSALNIAALGTASAGFTAAGFIVAGLISAAFSFGLSLLISKLMAPDDPNAINTTSFLFGPPENVAEQGGPVPIGYGRLMVAGKIVSVNALNVDKSLFEDQDFYNTIMRKNQTVASDSLDNVEGGSASNAHP